jgi:hypothetical protein
VDGRPEFSTPGGHPLDPVPSPPREGGTLEDLDAYIEEQGSGIDSLGAEPKWNGDRLFLVEAIDDLPE